jgi:hypothetical protein
MYTDIDYMHLWRDWSNHLVKFPLDQWRPFVDKLRNELHRHYVLILDPMIAAPMDDTDTYEVRTYVLYVAWARSCTNWAVRAALVFVYAHHVAKLP